MADLEFRELYTFDDLVTPRIIAVVFWLAEVTNLYVWIEILRSTYKSTSFSISAQPLTGTGTGLPSGTTTHINWETIIYALLMWALMSVVIRVVADLVLCVFRWQASTRGILMAMTGAPAAVAVTQAPTAPMMPAGAAPAARPTPVMTPPPWEGATPPASPPPAAPPPPDAAPPTLRTPPPTPPAQPPQG